MKQLPLIRIYDHTLTTGGLSKIWKINDESSGNDNGILIGYPSHDALTRWIPSNQETDNPYFGGMWSFGNAPNVNYTTVLYNNRVSSDIPVLEELLHNMKLLELLRSQPYQEAGKENELILDNVLKSYSIRTLDTSVFTHVKTGNFSQDFELAGSMGQMEYDTIAYVSLFRKIVDSNIVSLYVLTPVNKELDPITKIFKTPIIETTLTDHYGEFINWYNEGYGTNYQ